MVRGALMAQLTVREYDALESAIRDRRRIVVRRRRQDITVVPDRLITRGGREAIEARHPATGDHVLLWIDEAESVEVVPK
ncbi:MAG: hypothetical protein IT356_09250 [Gemmatimonadaceae bacterium]|nr:hypothetical protein [Gemmatimonadaceae bacterium]